MLDRVGRVEVYEVSFAAGGQGLPEVSVAYLGLLEHARAPPQDIRLDHGRSRLAAERYVELPTPIHAVQTVERRLVEVDQAGGSIEIAAGTRSSHYRKSCFINRESLQSLYDAVDIAG